MAKKKSAKKSKKKPKPDENQIAAALVNKIAARS